MVPLSLNDRLVILGVVILGSLSVCATKLCVANVLRSYLRIMECCEEKYEFPGRGVVNRNKTVVLTAHKAENTKTKTVYFY